MDCQGDIKTILSFLFLTEKENLRIVILTSTFKFRCQIQEKFDTKIMSQELFNCGEKNTINKLNSD